jgi:hypothetical protein
MYTVAMKIVAMHTAVMHKAAMHATAIANFAIQVVVIPAWQIGSPGVKAAGSVLPLTWTGPAAPAAPAGRALEDRPAPAPSVVSWMRRWNPCPKPGARIQLLAVAMIAISIVRILANDCLLICLAYP